MQTNYIELSKDVDQKWSMVVIKDCVNSGFGGLNDQRMKNTGTMFRMIWARTRYTENKKLASSPDHLHAQTILTENRLNPSISTRSKCRNVNHPTVRVYLFFTFALMVDAPLTLWYIW